eukprot:SAG31_NODE_2614_length_5375_cov_1.786391_2_plen_61_part_00
MYKYVKSFRQYRYMNALVLQVLEVARNVREPTLTIEIELEEFQSLERSVALNKKRFLATA